MAIIFTLVAISILILIHEAGHFWAAKKAGLLVEEFGIGFPPRLFQKKIGETIYSVNALPFGGFVRIYGEKGGVEGGFAKEENEEKKSRSFENQSAWRKAVVILAGVAMNFIFGWLLLSVVLMLGASQQVVVAEVAPASPASAIGIQVGDRIIGFSEVQDFVDKVNEHKGKEFEFQVKRGTEILPLLAVPEPSPAPGRGALGVALVEGGFKRLGFFSALKEGFLSSVEVMAQIVRLFGKLISDFFTRGELVKDVVGPVGVFSVAYQAGEQGFVYLLQLIALISLNLAALNAIPFPALDGGRLLFVVAEKIRGRAMNPKLEIGLNVFGIGLLLLLMIAITIRDIAGFF